MNKTYHYIVAKVLDGELIARFEVLNGYYDIDDAKEEIEAIIGTTYQAGKFTCEHSKSTLHIIRMPEAIRKAIDSGKPYTSEQAAQQYAAQFGKCPRSIKYNPAFTPVQNIYGKY